MCKYGSVFLCWPCDGCPLGFIVHTIIKICFLCDSGNTALL